MALSGEALLAVILAALSLGLVPLAWADARREARGRADLAPGRGAGPWRRRRVASVAGLLGAGLLAGVLLRPSPPRPGLESLDVVVLLDVSRSATARDLSPSRWEKARADLQRALPRLGGARLGLIDFAGEPRLLAPLTADRDAFEDRLLAARPTAMSVGGTATAPAIDRARELLRDSDRAAVVLLGDGEDHRPQELAAALARLSERGFSLFGVCYGRPGDVPLPGAEAAIRSQARPELLGEWCRATGGVDFDGAVEDPWSGLIEALRRVEPGTGAPPAAPSGRGYSVLGIALALLCWAVEGWGRRG